MREPRRYGIGVCVCIYFCPRDVFRPQRPYYFTTSFMILQAFFEISQIIYNFAYHGRRRNRLRHPLTGSSHRQSSALTSTSIVSRPTQRTFSHAITTRAPPMSAPNPDKGITQSARMHPHSASSSKSDTQPTHAASQIRMTSFARSSENEQVTAQHLRRIVCTRPTDYAPEKTKKQLQMRLGYGII